MTTSRSFATDEATAVALDFLKDLEPSMQSLYSQEGEQACLAPLLQWLQNERPFLSHDSSLLFKPQFCHLPPPQQLSVLRQLLRHHHLLPPAALVSFLQAVRPSSDRASSGCGNPWTHHLTDLLASLTNPGDIPGRHQENYIFQPETQATCNSLVSQLRGTTGVPGHSSRNPWRCRRRRMKVEHPGELTPQASDMPSSSQLLRDTQYCTQTPSGDSQEQSFISELFVQPGPSNEELFTDDSQLDVMGLHEVWHADQVDPEQPPAQLTCLVRASGPQVEILCSRLQFEALSETSLLAVSVHIQSLGAELSYTNARIIIRSCLFQRILDLTRNASRLLVTAVHTLLSSFPQPTLEEVIEPCLTNEASGGPQTDLSIRVIKEGLSQDTRQDLLRKLTKTSACWNEGVICVIQTLLDMKMDLENSDVTKIVDKLQAVGAELYSSNKFAKLLLTIIQKYGKQLDASQGVVLRQTVQKITSFLRKPALAALSRLDY